MRRVPEVHLLSMEPRSWSRPGLLSFGVPACVCPRPVGLPTWGIGKGCWGSGRTFAKCRTHIPKITVVDALRSGLTPFVYPLRLAGP